MIHSTWNNPPGANILPVALVVLEWRQNKSGTAKKQPPQQYTKPYSSSLHELSASVPSKSNRCRYQRINGAMLLRRSTRRSPPTCPTSNFRVESSTDGQTIKVICISYAVLDLVLNSRHSWMERRIWKNDEHGNGRLVERLNPNVCVLTNTYEYSSNSYESFVERNIDEP